eukprot:scaffold131920_cov72-Phaeocystis_antarctica.AAC.8
MAWLLATQRASGECGASAAAGDTSWQHSQQQHRPRASHQVQVAPTRADCQRITVSHMPTTAARRAQRSLPQGRCPHTAALTCTLAGRRLSL